MRCRLAANAAPKSRGSRCDGGSCSSWANKYPYPLLLVAPRGPPGDLPATVVVYISGGPLGATKIYTTTAAGRSPGPPTTVDNNTRFQTCSVFTRILSSSSITFCLSASFISMSCGASFFSMSCGASFFSIISVSNCFSSNSSQAAAAMGLQAGQVCGPQASQMLEPHWQHDIYTFSYNFICVCIYIYIIIHSHSLTFSYTYII